MLIQKDVSLRSVNTFGIDAKAAFYAELTHAEELSDVNYAIEQQNLALLLLGGGSNVLLANNFPGLVLRIMLKGISLEKKTPNHVFIRAMAGENWEDFVEYCVGNNWGGLENLTLIPGNVGTSPIQNIGAYGVELKDVFYSLEAYEIATGEIHTFYAPDCHFGYRNSFFKQEGKNKFIILSVCFRLTRQHHALNIHYGPVKAELENATITDPTLQDVMHAIQKIRRSKLPDPTELGNAGSFFKNPVLERHQLDVLKEQWPEIPAYEDGAGKVKTAAAWLIEQAGWKGFRENDAGVHQNQALVLVNYGNASGRQILELAQKIQASVQHTFGILLEMEVNIIE